jgi:Zinc finger, C2H2 type
MAPFSLLANVSATKAGGKRMLEDDLESALIMADGTEDEPASTPAPIYKKPSRAALKEMVTCRECHTPFKLIMQLNQHMTREGHLFPPCPECSIPFTTLESLIGHADAHASETVFTCKYCQKGVLGFDRYLYHMLMCKSLIRGDYVCFICRKSFRNSGSLKTHLLLHTGAKPFPCNYCSASFRQRHHRSHHERSVHLQMQGCADGVDQAPPSEGSAPEAGNVSASQVFRLYFDLS